MLCKKGWTREIIESTIAPSLLCTSLSFCALRTKIELKDMYDTLRTTLTLQQNNKRGQMTSVCGVYYEYIYRGLRRALKWP